MNKLQQRLFEEFDRFEKFSQYITKEDAARIASRVVLEVAEKAFVTGRSKISFEDFKKELLG